MSNKEEKLNKYVEKLEKITKIKEEKNNLAKIYGITRKEGKIYVVYEFFESNFSFLNTLKNFDFIEKYLIFESLCSSVSILNSVDVFVFTLNPSNVLTNDHKVYKIFDYGFDELSPIFSG